MFVYKYTITFFKLTPGEAMMLTRSHSMSQIYSSYKQVQFHCLKWGCPYVKTLVAMV